MNKLFTTPRIPGGAHHQLTVRRYDRATEVEKKNNHEESGLRSPRGTARGRRPDGSKNANRPPWGK